MYQIFVLSPADSYGDQVRKKVSPRSVPIFIPTNAEIVEAVIQNNGIGIVPVSNGFGGAVMQSWDALEKHREELVIAGSLTLPLDHAVVRRNGDTSGEVNIVYSHPQAYIQSKVFLDQSYHRHTFIPSNSTTGALEMLTQDGDVAICSAGAIRGNPQHTEKYQVMQEHISPPDNATKFLVIATRESVGAVLHIPPSEIDILQVTLEDKRGQLADKLNILSHILDVDIHEWGSAKILPGVSPLYTALFITSRIPREYRFGKMLEDAGISPIPHKEDLPL